MSRINVGILSDAHPLTEEQVKELEKRVLENKDTFAYLDENKKLCFAMPHGVDGLDGLAWHSAHELATENGKLIKRVYKRKTEASYELDVIMQKNSYEDSWGSGSGGSSNEPLPAGLYNANDELIVSWDALISNYLLNVEADYTLDNYNTGLTGYCSPYGVLNRIGVSGGVKLVVGSDITTIGRYAFCYCSNLTSIVLPASVTTINGGAFFNSGLVDITIPASTTNIDVYIFDFCRNLERVIFEGTVAQLKAMRDFCNRPGDDTGNYTIYCADGEITKSGTITMY